MKPALAAVAIVLLTAACAAAPHGTRDEADQSFANSVDFYLAQSDLPPDLREILVAARDAGEMTYEHYREAALLWMDCVTGLGFKAKLITTFNEGQTRFAAGFEYPVGITSEEDPGYASLTTAAEECRSTLFSPAEWLYISQPKAVELRMEYFERFREPTLACLRRFGSTLESDANVDEFQDESNVVAEATGTDCLYDVGYYDTGETVTFD